MPQVRKTNNPLEYRDLDGVIVTELQPPPGVLNAGANNAVFVGQFEKGPSNKPTLVSSIGELEALFGANLSYSGSKALRFKGFTNLYVLRAVASNSAKASLTLQDGSNQDIITFTAKYEGVYGNSLSVEVTAGTTANVFNVIVSDGNETETFSDVSIANKDSAEIDEIFGGSKFIDVSGASTLELEVSAQASLTGGDDGTIDATDYVTALGNNVNVPGKIYFADNQTAAVKTAITNHVKTEQDGIAIIGAESSSIDVADAITDYQTYADIDGRVLYAYNHVGYLNANGVPEYESPVFTMGSVISLTAPNIAINAVSNASFTRFAVGVQNDLGFGALKQLQAAGIMAMENDPDFGVRAVAPVTSNPQMTIIRRRMTDFIINTISSFLKNYQGEPNSFLTRQAIKAGIQDWYGIQVRNQILPADSELEDGGKAFLVETEGLTTDTEKAQGIIKILLKVRLFASARFIVLIAEIGENVKVEEEGA